MFGKGRKTETYLQTRDDMKAMHGRHARIDRGRASGIQGSEWASRSGRDQRSDTASASAPLPAVNAVSQKDLERMFEKFFRMGAVVALGELFGEGMLDASSVFEIREFLESFGVCNVDAVRSLGVTGPYLEDFTYIFAGAEQFPPAA